MTNHLSFTYFQLTAYLQQRLALPLPGEAAQQRMASGIRTALKLRATPDEKTRTGAVCILFYPKAGEWHIPLIVRPEYDGAHGGQVALPGGKVEESDATLADAALREMHEEIGVAAEAVQVVGQLTPLFVPASNFVVHPVVAVAAQTPVFQSDPYEVAQLLEVPFQGFSDSTRRGEKEILVRGFRVHAPYFDLAGQTVWGATAMILSEMSAVLNEGIRD